MRPLVTDALRDAKAFVPIKRPKGIRKRADKLCFLNATEIVLDFGKNAHPDLIERPPMYVEGLARWISGDVYHHAWITFDGVHAIDVTWKQPGIEYIGVMFDIEAVSNHILKNGPCTSMLEGAAP